MLFTIAREHLYWWPVKVRIPSPEPDKAGELVEHAFRMQFCAKPLDQSRAEREELARLAPAERELRQHEAMLDACRDWTDVVDEAGEPVPFSREALAAAMQASWFRLGVYRAYGQSLSAGEARLGN